MHVKKHFLGDRFVEIILITMFDLKTIEMKVHLYVYAKNKTMYESFIITLNKPFKTYIRKLK